MKPTLSLVLFLVVAAARADEVEGLYVRGDSWAASMAATRRRLSGTDRDALYQRLCQRFWNDFPETDWFMQDSPSRKSLAVPYDPVRDFGWYFEPRPDAEGERHLIQRVMGELGAGGAKLAAKLQTLTRAPLPPGDPAWLELYVQACRLRRQKRLEPLARQVPRIIFTKHYTLGGSHYAYTEGQSDAQAERHFVPGTALCLLEWDGTDFREKTLIEDPRGVIRDPDVAYDGRCVIFAWKKSDREDDYHLYEMDLPTGHVRQITRGLGVADYEPAYLPDGDIIFNSSRCVQIVDCWWTEVSNLYRCGPDGQFLRRLTFDQVHDNFPTVTEDGRVLYTRWGYNDRGQIYPQPLLQMNPDGTNQREFYGVSSWFPTTILHARGVPGTQKVLAVASGHHARQTGKLILIDPARGRQENAGIQLVAPFRETPAVKVDAYGQDGELFQYPYPVSETEYLVTYHPIGWKWKEGDRGPRFGVYFMTQDGRRERLAFDSVLPSSQPIPVRPRPRRRARPSLVDFRQTHGTCSIQNVYAGPALTGVPRGTVKRVRVVALDFRAAGIGSNRNRGPAGGALISTPVAIGSGTWDAKRILGEATVYDDGSACFRVPARTPIYFQLLDEKGRLVQSMRSWTSLQPGERASCVGCHDQENVSPEARLPLTAALQAGPETLEPFPGGPQGFSFPRQIQPILDRHCVRCHDGREGVPYDLTHRAVEDKDAKRRWSQAYLALTHARPANGKPGSPWLGDADHPLVHWISAQSPPTRQPPYAAGSNRSRLMTLLDQHHADVELAPEESAKLAAWIDLGVPFCGDYTEANLWSPAEREKYQRYFSKRRRLEAEDRANIAAWLQHAGGAGRR